MMTKLMMLVCFLGMALQSSAQKYTVEGYIDQFKYIAIEEMDESGIPASITLAQGILESRYGNSELTVASNNHFGIKCHDGWTGKRYYHDDDRKHECFRVYKDPAQSFRDHTDFLTTRSRYDFLFDYSSTDYKKWAHGLRQAGYATNPKYGSLLVDLIERHQLYLYDRPSRGAVANNAHRGRNNHQEVSTNSDYHMHDNTVHMHNSVDAGGQEAIFSYNRIRAVVAGKYDDIRLIADRHRIQAKRLMKYNDMAPGTGIVEGQLIYLQPKRGKTESRLHIVRADQDLWEISQRHGVKLYKLRQRNLLADHEEPVAGETIYLNRKADKKPAVRKFIPIQKQSNDEVIFETADLDEGVVEVIDHQKEREVVKVVVDQEINDEAPATQIQQDEEEAKIIVKEDLTENEDAKIEQLAKPEIRTSTQKFHTVKKGDTLYSVSKLYTVSIEDIKSWNKLPSNIISIDQQLIVGK